LRWLSLDSSVCGRGRQRNCLNLSCCSATSSAPVNAQILYPGSGCSSALDVVYATAKLTLDRHAEACVPTYRPDGSQARSVTP